MSTRNNRAKLLRKHTRTRELSVETLLARLSILVPALVRKQVRYGVADIPTKRTIRYYVREGLIDRPDHSGRRATFSYRHLLQVLAVKHLQTQRLPLGKIAEITASASSRELERMLLREDPASPVLSAVRRNSRALPDPLGCAEAMNVAISPAQPSTWKRFPIETGLEVLVETTFDCTDRIDALAARIAAVLVETSTAAAHAGAHSDGAMAPACPADGSGLYGPARPLKSRSRAVIALVTEGGLVPKGNPDRLEGARAGRYLKYSIRGLADLEEGSFESVDRGWDNTYVNADPDRLVPLDVMTELEQSGAVYKTHEFFYTTTGVAMPMDDSVRMGRDLAATLKKEGVSAVILTST
jgi:DNA-binding transcriptional MerR regulator